MSKMERDPHTGHMTTGHEWNGIKELNTHVPRPVFFFLGAAILFAIGYWVMMPAIPLGGSYTRGMLGYSDRAALAQERKDADAARSGWTSRLMKEAPAAVLADAPLMTAVRQSGRALFGDNCAACHGTEGAGGPGFPDLRYRSSTLWGRDADALAETIRVGINAAHPETRVAMMPAFGRDEMLTEAQIAEVIAYVRGLSTPTATPGKAGADLFADNCAACHGADGKGDATAGAPNLTDAHWIYGGDAQTLRATLWNGRQGKMPAWEDRLSPIERRILALYLADRIARE